MSAFFSQIKIKLKDRIYQKCKMPAPSRESDQTEYHNQFSVLSKLVESVQSR